MLTAILLTVLLTMAVLAWPILKMRRELDRLHAELSRYKALVKSLPQRLERVAERPAIPVR